MRPFKGAETAWQKLQLDKDTWPPSKERYVDALYLMKEWDSLSASSKLELFVREDYALPLFKLLHRSVVPELTYNTESSTQESEAPLIAYGSKLGSSAGFDSFLFKKKKGLLLFSFFFFLKKSFFKHNTKIFYIITRRPSVTSVHRCTLCKQRGHMASDASCPARRILGTPYSCVDSAVEAFKKRGQYFKV